MTIAAAVTTAAQRSFGTAALTIGADGRIAAPRQSGCARLFVPRNHRATAEAVFVNTAGGLTGGDRLESRATLGAGARLACTTQAAERIYRSNDGPARVTARLALGTGARLAWLPQETILYHRSHLDRLTVVEMAPDSELLMAEMLVLGRAAMGERDIAADIADTRRIRRGGRLILHDSQRLRLPLPGGTGSAMLGDAVALATVVCAAPDAGDRLAPARAALDAPGVEAAASAWEGKLVARLMSPSPHVLRRVLVRCLTAIGGGPLPRVWAVEECHS